MAVVESKTFNFANESFSGTDMVATCYVKLGNNEAGTVATFGSLQTLTYSIYMDRRAVRSIGQINAKDYVAAPRTIAGTLIFTVFDKHCLYKIIDDIEKNDTVKNANRAFLADEFPPFDITVSFANEYGSRGRLVIYGVRLMNEGQVMSINDVYTENTYNYVATDIEYLSNENGFKSDKKGGGYVIDMNQSYLGTPASNIINRVLERSLAAAEDKKIEINVTTKRPSFVNTKGQARISLYPTQDDGTIIISSKDSGEQYNFDVSETKNKSDKGIYVNLYPGDYIATYYESGSNKEMASKSFYVDEHKTIGYITYQEPVLKYVYHNAISLTASNNYHTKVKYAVYDQNNDLVDIRYKNLSSRSTVLTDEDGIIPNTKYYIVTCNDDDTNQSKAKIVTTLINKNFTTDLLREYINNNSVKNTQIYEEILIECQQYMDANPKSTILDALVKIKINSEKISDKKAACQTLLDIAGKYINDRAYCINQNSMSLNPPMPEMENNVSGIILIDKETTYVEIYRKIDNILQFVTKVLPHNFFDYSDEKKAFRFSGVEKQHYLVCAHGQNGVVSPDYEFYTLSDEEKVEYIRKNQVIIEKEKMKQEEVGRIRQATIADIKSIATKKIKDSSAIKLLMPPTIKNISQDTVTVNIEYNDIADTSLNLFLVMSDSKDAISQTFKYKKRFNPAFKSLDLHIDYCNFKNNNTYFLWIEDEYGQQISESMFFVYGDNVEQTNKEISDYFIKEILSKIKEYLSREGRLTSEVNEVISVVYDDDEMTTINIIDLLIKEIILKSIHRDKKVDCIESLLQAKHSLYDGTKQNINIANIDSSSIAFAAQDSYLLIHNINMLNGAHSYEYVDLNNEYIYRLNKSLDQMSELYVMPKNSVQRSKHVLIDHLNGKIKKY